jgi:hypothetical protein
MCVRACVCVCGHATRSLWVLETFYAYSCPVIFSFVFYVIPKTQRLKFNLQVISCYCDGLQSPTLYLLRQSTEPHPTVVVETAYTAHPTVAALPSLRIQ